jgi:hypothetical protein
VTLRKLIESLYAEGRIITELAHPKRTLPTPSRKTQKAGSGRVPLPTPRRTKPYACECGECVTCYKRWRRQERAAGKPALRPGPVPYCNCGTCPTCKKNAKECRRYYKKKGGLLADRRPPGREISGEMGRTGESAVC